MDLSGFQDGWSVEWSPFFCADAHVLFGFGESEGSRTAGNLRFVGEMHSLYPDLTCVGNSCMAIG